MRFLFVVLVSFVSALAQQLPASYEAVEANVVLEAELLKHTNLARQTAGVGTLQADETLALAARHHALEMSRLDYFSHESPTAENRTAAQRVARAGSPLVAIGENLAKVGAQDVAGVTTQGWLDSPGHRANLLRDTFTHAGFGTARAANGQILVVQMLASQPVRLTRAGLATRTQSYYDLTLDVQLSEAKESLFTFGDETTDLMTLAAGRQQLRLRTTEPGRVQLRGAVRAPTGDSFIVEDAGWLEPATNTYQADTQTPKNVLQILGVSAAPSAEPVYDISLDLENPGGRELAVFVAGEYQPEARTSATQFNLSVPSRLGNPEIAIGSLVGSGEVEVIMVLKVDTRYGKAQLTTR